MFDLKAGICQPQNVFDLYIICLKFINNIINYVTGLAETKKTPQDLSFTENRQKKSFLMSQKSEEKNGKNQPRIFSIKDSSSSD